MNKVVLAYSGGLHASLALGRLARRGWDVVAVAVDVGQPGDLSGAAARARRIGAAEARVVDARGRLVHDYVLPALRMNALHQGRYPLVSALSHPLIAEVLVEQACALGADAVAHGCTGAGRDGARLEASLSALAPDLRVLRPAPDATTRAAGASASAAGRPGEVPAPSPYSVDENLWGRIERGAVADAWASASDDVAVAAGAAEAVEVEVGFERGVPVSLDGERADPQHVVEGVGKIAGSFGFGRVDVVHGGAGAGAGEVYEAPAALALIAAHRDLEALTLDRLVAREKRRLEAVWSGLVHEGLWHSPLRAALDAFADATQEPVGGRRPPSLHAARVRAGRPAADAVAAPPAPGGAARRRRARARRRGGPRSAVEPAGRAAGRDRRRRLTRSRALPEGAVRGRVAGPASVRVIRRQSKRRWRSS